MRYSPALILALAAPTLALPLRAYAEDEGTYSTYSARETQLVVAEANRALAELDREGQPGGRAADVASDEDRVWTREEMFDGFYRWLEPYGTWEEDTLWGWLWYPSEPDFRPFNDGRWRGGEQGAQYESEAPWAWAVYHYGRWIFFANRGWAWVPGYQWAETSVRFDDYQRYLASGEVRPDPEEPPVVVERPVGGTTVVTGGTTFVTGGAGVGWG
ncbi:MAG: DUF6600 domain-containing protein, partial [Myxococcales bacterium]